MFSPRNRTNLKDPFHTQRLLTHINFLFGQKASRLEFRVPGDRYSASACTGVTIDPVAETIVYNDPAGNAKSYAVTDIEIIKRLRNKKYLIAFKS